MFNKNKIFFKKGFTLVEMLVASAIFTVFMVVAVGALMSIISANDRAQAIKTVIDNVTFAVDDMARNIRSGTNYEGSNDYGNTWSCTTAGCSEIQSISGATTTYYKFVQSSSLSTGQQGNIQECIFPNPGDCSNTSIYWQSLTAPTSTVSISNMTFYVFGDGTNQQPRVLITVTGFIPNKNGASTEFDIQTTASQRLRN